jgi:hypothetical protein
MLPCIVELNDCEIRVADGAGIVVRSPGVAVLDKDDLHLGEAAVKLAYLNPRSTYNRYWYKLSEDALPITTRRLRHHADLVYSHLLKLHEQAGAPAELLFAVPGSYSEDQLSMLLGIAAACPFNAVGLIDVAVAGGASIGVRGEYQHIDIHLHQTVITRLRVEEMVTRTGVETIAEYGLHKIYSAVSDLVADLFIQQSRFDPLHHAETEQSLYDQLPDCLLTLASQREITLEITHRGTTHQAKLSRDALLQKLQPLFDNINSHIAPGVTCLIGDRLAGITGFTESLADYAVLNPESVFESCRRFSDQIRSAGPELRFITTLPAQAAGPVARPAVPATTARISHILCRHHAYPAGAGTVYLSRAGQVTGQKTTDTFCAVAFNRETGAMLTVTGDSPVFVNGKQAAHAMAVHPGDRVHAGDAATEFQFISVVGDHG